MSRGGKRAGTPGTAYKNRSDLQAVKVAPGQPYGQAQQLENAQRVIPLPNTGNQLPPAPASGSQPPAGAGGPMLATAGQQDFARPTEQPGVPVTAGLPSGPGPGPEALQAPIQQNDQVSQRLRMLYAMSPNNDVLRLIELHDNGY